MGAVGVAVDVALAGPVARSCYSLGERRCWERWYSSVTAAAAAVATGEGISRHAIGVDAYCELGDAGEKAGTSPAGLAWAVA